jgi:Kdo2-lipid IVA lauroyltransferase/acyltransferase
MYYFVYGILWLISLLPLRVLYILSDFFYGLIFYVSKYRRNVTMTNLRIAFPEKTEKERKAIAKKFYRNFTDNFMEVIKLTTASPRYIQKHFTGDYSLFDKLYEEGKRCQSLLAHNFNWEWACVAGPLGMKQRFLVVYMPVGSRIFERIIMKLRKRTGAVLLPATNMRTAIFPYRNESYNLVLVADQSPGDPTNGLWLDFLNRPAPFLKAPESGARRGNTPVLFAKIIKERRGYYKVIFEMGEEHPASLQPGELTKKYVAFLEQFIREYPEMWLWSHRRWKWEWKPEYGPVIQ